VNRLARQIFTVAQVNRYAKRLLEADALLAGLFIEGEISNFNAHGSGHLYFSLKDSAAALSAVMFNSHAAALPFAPKNGLKVIAFGRLSLYEKTGQYQLYVEFLEPAGIGGLHLAFAQLCEKLQAEGLFDPACKRPLPAFARTVAVITSPTGAAVRDIIATAQARDPSVRLAIVPALVQGEAAPADLVRAIDAVNRWGEADLLIIGRGGGSIEDLWAFNDETVARALAASAIPTISAVGHETDTTVTDFVADARAATPTAAAQLAIPDARAHHRQLQTAVRTLQAAIRQAILTRHHQAKFTLRTLTRHLQTRLAQETHRLAHHETLLEKISPHAIFARGLAFAKNERNQPIKSVAQVSLGEVLTLHWADGSVDAEVKVKR